jgi:hypothetical protein
MKTIKHHKTFGQVEVLSYDTMFTTIVILSTGEQKKLANKFACLSDKPIEKSLPRKAKAKVDLSKEDMEILELRAKARKAMDNDHISFDLCEYFGNKNGFYSLCYEGKMFQIRPENMIYVNGFLAIPKKLIF